MRKALVVFVTSFILASSLLLVGSAEASDPSISITPDTSVFVYGGDSVRIWIYAYDPDPADMLTVEKTVGIGTYVPNTGFAPISDEFYFHPDTSGVYTFIFPVTDGQGATDADTTKLLVLAKKVDFSQSANDDSPYPPGDIHWISSILQQSNSTYYEGMSTLQRLVFINIPKTPGHVHTLNFSHQANKATSHAYDFLTSWPQGVQAGTEIGGPTMFVNLNECGPDIGPPADLGPVCAALHTSGFTTTTDVPDAMGNLLGDDIASKVAAYEAHLGNRTVKIYGNTPISAASMAFNGYTGSTDKDADYTLTWTSSSDSIVIEMAGHLAAGVDPVGQTGVGYDAGTGSSNISGGPYHFKLGTLDGATLGSQDNQIKGADIKPRPPVCDVTPESQVVCVGSDATFTDNSTGGTPPYTFCWQKSPYTDPCISTTNQLSITGATLADAGTYRVIVTDDEGGADTCECTLTVFGLPPEIVCPDDDSVHAGDYFISTDFSALDPDGGPVTVALCGITPPPIYAPVIVGSHVEWQTDCHEAGKVFTICLEATDSCGGTDICYFDVTVVNAPPELTCPEDDSVHAQELFVSTDFSVYDPDGDTGSVFILDISPSATNYPIIVDQHVEWQTTCQEDGDYVIRLVASECCQPRDTCEFTVTVYNRPPELICPENAMLYAGDTLISTDFSVTDPDGDTAPVTFLYIDPSATNDPTIVGNHVEWITTANEADREFDIFLVATDPCGLADTCNFTVTVVSVPINILDCPENDSVHATVPAVKFVSTNFSVTGPGADPSRVQVISIDPSPAGDMPYRVESHIEWLTDCDDAGKTFTICLEATFDVGPKDTCCFYVTVYNRPPELTCPDDDTVYAGETLVSSDFSVTDPDEDSAPVSILDINPPPTNNPTIVGSHVEWVTTFSDSGDYDIRLVAADPCELADTCQFSVKVIREPTGNLVCPEDDSIHATDPPLTFVSTDFTITGPGADPSQVTVWKVEPPPTNWPHVEESHVEWLTDCDDADKTFTIWLEAPVGGGERDTCHFQVVVYNRPPVLTCPDYGRVAPNETFISTDFHVTDPDEDPVTVAILDISPPPNFNPAIVENHVEWTAWCGEEGRDYLIRLVATDPCSLKDTCEFTVSVSLHPDRDFYILVHPLAQYVTAGHSAEYSVELNSMFGFAEACSLLVSNLPDPPNSGVFDQVVVVPTGSTNLIIYTTTLTDTGTYSLIITGKEISGPIAHSAQVFLRVLESTEVEEGAYGPDAPRGFTLFQNQPNPFNPETQISYRLPRAGKVCLTVYNVLGRRIKTLFDGHQAPGIHTVSWDGRDENGLVSSSGIYFYRLQADDFDQTKRMILMK